MPHLFSFSTRRFDISKEPENDINPIPGHAVLSWVRSSLPQAYALTEPQTEDWGWYIYAEAGGTKYLVGASGEPREAEPDVDWIVQLHTQPTFMDKLKGRNKLLAQDTLSVEIERLIRAQPDFLEVSVERGT
jgi:hypothetical protein